MGSTATIGTPVLVALTLALSPVAQAEEAPTSGGRPSATEAAEETNTKCPHCGAALPNEEPTRCIRCEEERAASKRAYEDLPEWQQFLKGISLGPGKLDIGGSIRGRYEWFDNFNVKQYHPNRHTKDHVLLERVRLTLDYHLTDHAHAFVMFQDSHYWLNEISRKDAKGPHPYLNPWDLRQAYVEWKHIGGSPLGFKVGRQAICYRDKRVYGPGNWGNVGRYAWDAAKAYVDTDVAKLDAICGQRVEFESRDFDDKHFEYDMYALYLQTKKLPVDFDVFYTLKHEQLDSTNHERRHTVGAYVDYKHKLGWDAGGTAAVQRGKFRRDSDIEAYGYNARLGYTFDLPWSPRLGVEHIYASGDSNPNDTTHETFDTIFSAADCYYGRMNLFCWKNIEDYQFSLSLKPRKGLKIWVDYNIFRLAQRKDSWYWVSGRPQRTDATGTTGRSLGHEIDLLLKWQLTKNLELFTGFGHFFPSRFIEKNGPHGDANWAFMQLMFTF